MHKIQLAPITVLKKFLTSIGCILLMIGIPISVVNTIYIVKGNKIDGFPIDISFLIITFLPFYILTLFPLIYLEVKNNKRLLNYILSGILAPQVIIVIFGLMVAWKTMPPLNSDPDDFNMIASQLVSGGSPLIHGFKMALSYTLYEVMLGSIYTSLYWFFAVKRLKNGH